MNPIEVKCLNCGKFYQAQRDEIHFGAGFGPNDKPKYCTEDGTLLIQMKCDKCGKESPKVNNNCIYCGNRFAWNLSAATDGVTYDKYHELERISH